MNARTVFLSSFQAMENCYFGGRDLYELGEINRRACLPAIFVHCRNQSSGQSLEGQVNVFARETQPVLSLRKTIASLARNRSIGSRPATSSGVAGKRYRSDRWSRKSSSTRISIGAVCSS